MKSEVREFPTVIEEKTYPHIRRKGDVFVMFTGSHQGFFLTKPNSGKVGGFENNIDQNEYEFFTGQLVLSNGDLIKNYHDR